MNNKIGEVEVFYRKADYFNWGFVFGLALHPILKDWKGNYHELTRSDWKIVVLSGNLKKLSLHTREFFRKKRFPRQRFLVDKKKFLKSVKEMRKRYVGKKYRLLDFKGNSIGFKNYVLKNSVINRGI